MANKQLKKRGDRKKPRRNPSAGSSGLPPGVYKARYVVDGNDSYYVLDSVSSVAEEGVVEMRKNEKGEWEK